MKPLLITLLLLGGLSAGAQTKKAPMREPDERKPLLFGSHPQASAFKPESLDHLIGLPVGDTVSFLLSPGLRVQGVVVSVSDGLDKDLQSVVIRCRNYGNATFSLSRRRLPEGAEYSGRLLSEQHGDALELVGEDGRYRLEKRRLYDILSD